MHDAEHHNNPVHAHATEAHEFAVDDLDTLSADELEDLLAEAQEQIAQIRSQLQERQKRAGGEIDISFPRRDLNEARGRWADFVAFVRGINRP